MSNPDILDALQALATDKGITVDTLFAAMADALESAYKRLPDAYEYAWVTIDPDNVEFRVMAQELDDEGDPVGPEFEVTPPQEVWGRVAAQTMKQVMSQRIREAEREMKYEEYAGPRGRHRHRHHPAERQPLHAARPRSGRGAAAPGRAGALRAPRARTPREGLHRRGAQDGQGPPDRGEPHPPGLIKRLFELEVPEIADGVVEIKACAREPGARTKIAVYSNDGNVDPVGACVGARGARVRMVVNELRGEKIDIVPFSDDSSDFVMKALSPAKVKEVRIHEDTGVAEVIVPDYQLSLAIGKEGQNARLAARLTGWRVDIKSETQLAEEEAYLNQDWAEGSGSSIPPPASRCGSPPRAARPCRPTSGTRPPSKTSTATTRHARRQDGCDRTRPSDTDGDGTAHRPRR